jgi:hypothetical protein
MYYRFLLLFLSKPTYKAAKTIDFGKDLPEKSQSPPNIIVAYTKIKVNTNFLYAIKKFISFVYKKFT